MKDERLSYHGAQLDVVDQQILSELSADARIPNKLLAERVGVAPSTCSMRLRRLVRIGAIRGHHADVDPVALGRPLQAIIAVRVQPAARPRIGALSARLARLPGVLNVFFVAGAEDFLIQVAAGSTEELRHFVADNLSGSREFTSTQTSLVFEHVRGQDR
ncbi:Lrp/AsnC family transcriptional regulator [Nocardioides sp. 1609]|uniref:Lrp/AsnC family transcriptional regulator n=1 Tax=Nocardioides sp. 1609 TaxID=2508327 RepID=UPI0010702BC2|nr:Lrp/AsnC family transcriptional regulator [Nocardioides sp. 1609]